MAVLIPRRLEYPFTLDQLGGLRVGQLVSVSGKIVTARDRIHKYLFEGGKSPVDLKDGAIYHCGPVIVRKGDGWVVKAAGPTTSSREEPYLHRIIKEHGVRLVIGKGALGRNTEQACVQCGCVYLHAVGGAAQILAEKIVGVAGGYFTREFGLTEAMWELTVKDFPAVVAIDTRGRSLIRRVQHASRRVLARMLAGDDAFVAA
jgi:tartrate/fumarate subfamily iron-sulfur-dependent hydro-lyase beta chain